MPRASNNGGKHSSRGIITGEAGFDHTGTVVAHDGADLTVVCTRQQYTIFRKRKLMDIKK